MTSEMHCRDGSLAKLERAVICRIPPIVAQCSTSGEGSEREAEDDRALPGVANEGIEGNVQVSVGERHVRAVEPRCGPGGIQVCRREVPVIPASETRSAANR